MSALLVDSYRGTNRVDERTRRGASFEGLAHDRRALVRVPAPVLGEVCRGPSFDAAIKHLLNDCGVSVLDLTRSVAQRAGQLLAEARTSPANAVDAFGVASAFEFDRAVIATGDPKDIRRLAARHRSIGVFPI